MSPIYNEYYVIRLYNFLKLLLFLRGNLYVGNLCERNLCKLDLFKKFSVRDRENKVS